MSLPFLRVIGYDAIRPFTLTVFGKGVRQANAEGGTLYGYDSNGNNTLADL